MATLAVPTKMDPMTGMILNMLGLASTPGDPAFDSYLLTHNDGGNNHTLTLVLKIHLDPVLPASAKLPAPLRMLYPDSDNNFLLVKPWGASEWLQFKNRFKQECALWTNRFWLTPPPGFSGLDVKVGGRTTRPNVYCHLYIDLVDSPAGAHRSIVVVNLDKAANPFFRSDSMHYNSEDVNPGPTDYKDNKGQPMLYYTVAHEVGHALGLPHIGVTRGDPLCKISVFVGDYLPDSVQTSSFLPAIFKDGSNAQACYGTSAPPDRGKNVMGMGSAFDASNARPWLQRLALHTATKLEAWTVSLKLVPPNHL